MRLVAIVSGLLILTSFTATSEKGTFYAYKGAGKLIDKITRLMVSDSVDMEFGFQSYNKYKIKNTTSFYNQPSDILHYVLTTEGQRTLHFQVPVLNVKSIIVHDPGDKGKPVMEVLCKEEAGVKVKEHNQKGGIIFSVKYSTYSIPLSPTTDLKKLSKYTEKLMKKVNQYNGA